MEAAPRRLLVVWHGFTGATRAMAEAVAGAARGQQAVLDQAASGGGGQAHGAGELGLGDFVLLQHRSQGRHAGDGHGGGQHRSLPTTRRPTGWPLGAALACSAWRRASIRRCTTSRDTPSL